MKDVTYATLLAIGASAMLLVGAAPPVPKGPSRTADGVYAAGQAVEGAVLYAAQCAMCHGERLEGTFEIPALKGRFVANWAGSPLGALYDYVGEAMPQHAPGTLDPQDRARIVAFLLRENGMPAGASPLATDRGTLDRIAFTAPPVPAK